MGHISHASCHRSVIVYTIHLTSKRPPNLLTTPAGCVSDAPHGSVPTRVRAGGEDRVARAQELLTGGSRTWAGTRAGSMMTSVAAGTRRIADTAGQAAQASAARNRHRVAVHHAQVAGPPIPMDVPADAAAGRRHTAHPPAPAALAAPVIPTAATRARMVGRAGTPQRGPRPHAPEARRAPKGTDRTAPTAVGEAPRTPATRHAARGRQPVAASAARCASVPPTSLAACLSS